VQIVSELDPLRSAVAKLKREGALALVPTMGALHEGHLALVREARKRAAHVAVSIFVNPRQFGPKEDLAAYPRDPEGDAAKAGEAGATVLFTPALEEMYRDGRDAVLLRIAPSGSLQWLHRLGGGGDARVDGLAALADGRIVAFGRYRGPADARADGENDLFALGLVERRRRRRAITARDRTASGRPRRGGPFVGWTAPGTTR